MVIAKAYNLSQNLGILRPIFQEVSLHEELKASCVAQ